MPEILNFSIPYYSSLTWQIDFSLHIRTFGKRIRSKMFDVLFLRMWYIYSKSFVKVWKEPRKTSKVRRRSTFIFKWSRKFCYAFLFFLYIFILHIHVVLLALVLPQIIAHLFKNSRFKSYNYWESLQKLILKLASFPIINAQFLIPYHHPTSPFSNINPNRYHHYPNLCHRYHHFPRRFNLAVT